MPMPPPDLLNPKSLLSSPPPPPPTIKDLEIVQGVVSVICNADGLQKKWASLWFWQVSLWRCIIQVEDGTKLERQSIGVQTSFYNFEHVYLGISQPHRGQKLFESTNFKESKSPLSHSNASSSLEPVAMLFLCLHSRWSVATLKWITWLGCFCCCSKSMVTFLNLFRFVDACAFIHSQKGLS